jgi:hypothetical protein
MWSHGCLQSLGHIAFLMRAILVGAPDSRRLVTWRGLTIVAEDVDAQQLAAMLPDGLHPEPVSVESTAGTISFAAWLCVTHRDQQEEPS